MLLLISKGSSAWVALRNNMSKARHGTARPLFSIRYFSEKAFTATKPKSRGCIYVSITITITIEDTIWWEMGGDDDNAMPTKKNHHHLTINHSIIHCLPLL
eukprot:516347_1